MGVGVPSFRDDEEAKKVGKGVASFLVLGLEVTRSSRKEKSLLASEILEGGNSRSEGL